jgi:hypothetical protein
MRTILALMMLTLAGCNPYAADTCCAVGDLGGYVYWNLFCSERRGEVEAPRELCEKKTAEQLERSRGFIERLSK